MKDWIDDCLVEARDLARVYVGGAAALLLIVWAVLGWYCGATLILAYVGHGVLGLALALAWLFAVPGAWSLLERWNDSDDEEDW